MIQKSKRSRKAQEEHSICRFEHPEVSPLPTNREFRQGLSAVTAQDQSSYQQYHRNGRRMPQILYLLIKKGIGELQDDTETFPTPSSISGSWETTAIGAGHFKARDLHLDPRDLHPEHHLSDFSASFNLENIEGNAAGPIFEAPGGRASEQPSSHPTQTRDTLPL